MFHLDENDFPCTKEDDGSLNKDDQLQRAAMVYLAGHKYHSKVIKDAFQVSPGIYRRNPAARPEDLSGDALISILAAWVGNWRDEEAKDISWQILKRFGFSQNTHDMYGRQHKKIPDFILLRALPLMWRSSDLLFNIRCTLFAFNLYAIFAHSAWWILATVFTSDLPLLLAAVMANAPVWKDDKGFEKRTPDDVDDNVLIMTFVACSMRTQLTPLGYWSPRLFAALRPWNYGCRGVRKSFGKDVDDPYLFGPVYGALRWYHRLPKGNDSIAHIYRGIVFRFFGEENPEEQVT